MQPNIVLYFKSTGILNLGQCKKVVCGTLDPANVTIIFKRWMEVGTFIEKFTVSSRGSYCARRIGDPLINDFP